MEKPSAIDHAGMNSKNSTPMSNFSPISWMKQFVFRLLLMRYIILRKRKQLKKEAQCQTF